jgi:hypothetical protein
MSKLLYISLSSELIFRSYSPDLIQIWSPSSSSSSSKYEERQNIKIFSGICSLCQMQETEMTQI